MATTDTPHDGSSEGSAGRSKHRSPNYPLFDLEKAVELTKKLYATEKVHKVPVGLVHERWGYKKHSAAGNQAIAAVKSYGLIVVEGEGDSRKIAVSDAGRRIALGAPEAAKLLKDAAVSPTLFDSLWQQYRMSGIPSDEALAHELVFSRNFNEDIVARVVERFKASIQYAKLDMEEALAEATDDPQEAAAPEIERSHRSLVNFPPKRRDKTPTGVKEDVFSLDEGSVVLQWPERLSKTSADDLQDWLALIGRKIARAADNTERVIENEGPSEA